MTTEARAGPSPTLADAGSRRSTPAWVRSMRYWLYQYKRTWRGSITTSFLYPVLYLAAMGVGLGSLVKHPVGGEARYLDFLAPGLLASTAMQIGGNEAMYPVMAAIKWLRTYFAMLATPLTVIDVLVGHLAWIAVRLVMVTSIYLAIMAAFGTVHSAWAILALPVGVLTGMAFAAPIAAFAATQQHDTGFSTIYRLGLIPLFLFSGTFFPIALLPGWLQTDRPGDAALPRCGALPRPGARPHRPDTCRRTPRLPARAHRRRLRAGPGHVPAEARHVTGRTTSGGQSLRIAPVALFGTRRARRLVERNIMVYRRGWVYFVSGFFEPFFYLLSIGVGLGKLVGTIHVGHQLIPYTSYVAPGLLASSAMNGATIDSTFNVFFKLKIAKTYDAVLSTPLGPGDIALGELAWSLMRATIYSASFLVVMAGLGYVLSPWAILLLPAAMSISFAFSAVGMAGTTYMRSWQDFDKVSLALIPLFLFSATFYPLTVYPGWLQAVVRCTPLYQGVVLLRGLDTGIVSWSLAGHFVYLIVAGLLGLIVATKRMAALLLP